MKKISKNQQVNYFNRLGVMAYKSVSYLFIGVLLFLMSCNDSSSTGPTLIQIKGENFTLDPLDTSKPLTEYQSLKESFEYGTIKSNNNVFEPTDTGVEISYEIVESKDLENVIKIDKTTGVITVAPNLITEVGAYDFKVKVTVTGSEDYEGSTTIDQTLYITKKLGPSDYTVGKTSFINQVGRNFTITNPVTLETGITATYNFNENNDSNNLPYLTLDKNTGDIEVIPGLGVKDYTFKLDIIGTGAYTATNTIDLALKIEKRAIEEADFEVAVADSTRFLGGYYGKVVLKNAVTVDLEIVDIKDGGGKDIPNDDDKITINPSGEIKIKGDLPQTNYTFSLKINDNGSGNYTGSVINEGLSFTVAPALELRNFQNAFDDSLIGGLITTKVGDATYLLYNKWSKKNTPLKAFELEMKDNNLTIAEETSSEIENMNSSRLSAAVVGSTNYVFATHNNNSKTVVFSLDKDGVLKEVDEFKNETLQDRPKHSFPVVIDGTTYLLVTSQPSLHSDSGFLSLFKVAENGELNHITTVKDTSILNLGGAQGVTSAVVAGKTYAFATSYDDDAISVFEIKVGENEDNVTLDNVHNVKDQGEVELDGALYITSAKIGEETYIFVSANVDNGLSVFRVESGGALVNVDNLDKDANAMLLDLPADSDTVKIGDATYLFVASSGDNAVNVFEVVDGGKLKLVATAKQSDNPEYRLERANQIDLVKTEDKTYLFAGGFGLSAFEVIPLETQN